MTWGVHPSRAATLAHQGAARLRSGLGGRREPAVFVDQFVGAPQHLLLLLGARRPHLLAKMEEGARKAGAELERRRAALGESEKARAEAARKEALAYFDRLPKPPSAEVQAEVQAIRDELWNLRQKVRTASPKEQEEILRRAYELVHKYGRLTAPAKP